MKMFAKGQHGSMIEIVAPGGTKAYPYKDWESEYVLKRGLKLKLLSVNTSGSMPHYKMEIVPQYTYG